MQAFLALETLIIALAMPCIVSWMLGEMHGANRMQKLAESGLGLRRDEQDLAFLPHAITRAESETRQFTLSINREPAIAAEADVQPETEDTLWRKRELEAMWAEIQMQNEPAGSLETNGAAVPDLETALGTFRATPEDTLVPRNVQNSEEQQMQLVQAM